jgi:adenosine kinase
MDILLTGSVAFDYLMKFPGYFRDHILADKLDSISLSFLVESMVRRRGGIAPNIAYNLALLGGKPRVYASVGEDFEEYRDWLEKHGVDTSEMRVIPGEYTASFFVNTDQSNAQIASFYPGAMAFADQLSLHDLSGDLPDLIVISPNDPKAMVRYAKECQELDIPYLYDPSQQIPRLEDDKLRSGVAGAFALFVNDYEFGMIQKRTGMTPSDVLGNTRFTVVTCGEEGSVIYTQEGDYHVPVVPPKEIVDPTGVGDAFRGGFLTGYGREWDWETCGRVGALAATYCLESDGPQGQHYTREAFRDRYRRHFDDRGVLDEIV